MNGTSLLDNVLPDPNPGCEHICLYNGIRCSQSPHVLIALDSLTEALGPETARIIEIGTLYGGFTWMLADHVISQGIPLVTFDVNDNRSLIRPENVKFIKGDVFTGAAFRTLTHLIGSPGRTILFCDGGDKEREVREFSRYLKPGDVILCHDYLRDPSIYCSSETSFWPGYESQWANIKDELTKNSCVPFLEKELQLAVWGCFIRQ